MTNAEGLPWVVYIRVGVVVSSEGLADLRRLAQSLIAHNCVLGVDTRHHAGEAFARQLEQIKDLDFVTFGDSRLMEGPAGHIELPPDTLEDMVCDPEEAFIDNLLTWARIVMNSRTVVVFSDGTRTCGVYWWALSAAQCGGRRLVRYMDVLRAWAASPELPDVVGDRVDMVTRYSAWV